MVQTKLEPELIPQRNHLTAIPKDIQNLLIPFLAADPDLNRILPPRRHSLLEGSQDSRSKIINEQFLSEMGISRHVAPLVVSSLDGRYVLFGLNGTAQIHDLVRHRTICTLQGPGYYMKSAAISASGTHAIIVATEWQETKQANGSHFAETVKVWDLRNTSLKNIPFVTLTGHNCPVNKVVLSEDADWALSGGSDGKVILWDLRKNVGDVLHPHATLDRHNGNSITALAMTPNALWGVSGAADGSVILWNLTTGGTKSSPLRQLYIGAIETVFITSDGRWVTATTDKSSSAWYVAEVYKRRYEIASCLASNDKQVIGQFADAEISLWNLEITDRWYLAKKETLPPPNPLKEKELELSRHYLGLPYQVKQLCMSLNGRCIIAAYLGTHSNEIYFWNLTNSIRTSCYLDSIYEVQLAVTSNCQWALLQDDRSIHIWDLSPATNSEYNLSPWILSLLIALSKTSTLSDDERLFYATQLDTIQNDALKKEIFGVLASKGSMQQP